MRKCLHALLASVLSTAILCHVPEVMAQSVHRINTWAVIGPFNPDNSSGYDVDFVGGEVNAIPYLCATVNGMKWEYFDDRTYNRNQDDYVDLYSFYMDARPAKASSCSDTPPPAGGTEGRVAYAGNWVWVSSTRQAKLKFGANDMAKVWLNGQLVLAQPTAQQAKRDATQVAITLQAGWNRLIVKVVNNRRLWGFYASLTNTDGSSLRGAEFTPHDPGPGDPLVILTPALPDGYAGQPYVALDANNPSGAYPLDHPSASPFRMVGRGATAPWKWTATGLPTGLSMSLEEGEITGIPTAYGPHTVTITMSNAARTLNVSRTYTLTIRPRLTWDWWEQATLGGLQHGGSFELKEPEYQAEIIAKQGYTWIASTLASTWNMPQNSTSNIAAGPEVMAYRHAIRSRGVRYGHYICLQDHLDGAGQMFSGTPREYLEGLHDAIEKFHAIDPLDPPVVFWFDCLTIGRPAAYTSWDLDGLFSLIKTLNPSAIVLVNSGMGGQDYQMGDLDVVSWEGNNNCAGQPSCDHMWTRWPGSPRSNNPKYLPSDVWRYPNDRYMDWVQWAKVIVSMIGEPANFSSVRMVNLDHTPTSLSLQMHSQLGDWLQPRKHAILGTVAYPITPASWGYAVQNRSNGYVYLHILSNSAPIPKSGWTGGATLQVGPVDFVVTGVSIVPTGDARSFSQSGSTVSIDMTDMNFDGVDTILELRR